MIDCWDAAVKHGLKGGYPITCSFFNIRHVSFTSKNYLFELEFTNSSEILKVKVGIFLHVITVEKNLIL